MRHHEIKPLRRSSEAGLVQDHTSAQASISPTSKGRFGGGRAGRRGCPSHPLPARAATQKETQLQAELSQSQLGASFCALLKVLSHVPRGSKRRQQVAPGGRASTKAHGWNLPHCTSPPKGKKKKKLLTTTVLALHEINQSSTLHCHWGAHSTTSPDFHPKTQPLQGMMHPTQGMWAGLCWTPIPAPAAAAPSSDGWLVQPLLGLLGPSQLHEHGHLPIRTNTSFPSTRQPLDIFSLKEKQKMLSISRRFQQLILPSLMVDFMTKISCWLY